MRLPKKTKPYHLKDVKFGLVISVIAISIIGVMVIGSAKQAVQGRQIIGLVAGVILMIILSTIAFLVAVILWIFSERKQKKTKK